MDLSINSVNFGGRKEVLYGLKRAANEARNAEVCRALCSGPRPLYNKAAEGKTSEALAEAYMDMAVYDDEFFKTIKEFPQEGLKELRGILKPEKREFCEINPLKVFKKALVTGMKKHNKPVEVDVLNNFFKNITDKFLYKV